MLAALLSCSREKPLLLPQGGLDLSLPMQPGEAAARH